MSRIKLRALTINDLPKTLAWHNQEDIRDLYLEHPFPVNKEMEELWYNKILKSNYPATVFGIEECKTKELIGITLLKDINNIHRKAEVALYIGDKKYRGKGLSKEATIATLSFAFEKLGLNRVYLNVLARNEAAIKLYNDLGFKKEGHLVESIFKNNKFENEIIMALLKVDFDKADYKL